MVQDIDSEVEGEGTTSELSNWITELKLSDVPSDVVERAKYLILDGIGCGLVGSHVPWSEQMKAATDQYEPAGDCSVIGYNEKYGPLAAAILNGSFIQGTELDDYHSIAPLHSTSVILPTLFAGAEAQKHTFKDRPAVTSGKTFLLAAIVGFEVGPRVGNALYGVDMLTRGWHSGPIFGSPAAAACAAKLFDLSADNTESAIGIACTQAGGLMSAQYGGMIKRSQHAFAARNGLFGALLARKNYVGIKKVFERPYGGFLTMFSDVTKSSPYKIHEITKDLNEFWHTTVIRVKLHAAVGGSHGQIECLAKMQNDHPARFAREKLHTIKHMTVYLSAAIFAHNGWLPESWPLLATGGQMCSAFIGASQLVDGQVLLAQFSDHNLKRDELRDLTFKTTCEHSAEFDADDHGCGARIKVEFDDGVVIEDALAKPKGFDPPIENVDILNKWRLLAITVVDEQRMKDIERLVLGLDTLDDITDLIALLAQPALRALN